MEGCLIPERDFIRMASLPSVTEAAAFLVQYRPYAGLFVKKDPESMHRSEIEKLLLKGKYDDFTKIYRFANVHQKNCMDLFFLHYEEELIKRCLRSCLNHRPLGIDFSENADFFLKHGKLDVRKLTAADSLDSLLTVLSDTIWYEPLKKLSGQENVRLFDYEEGIDLFYFKTIWSSKDRILKKEENELFSACFGTRLDLLNLQWIYRSRKYYHLSDAEIFSMLIPIYYRLRKEEIRFLTESADEKVFLERLKDTWYGKQGEKLFREIPDLEQLYASILNKLYETTAKKDPYSFAIINSYLHRKEAEIHRIITVIESIRYSLPSQEILSGGLKSEPGGSLND